MHGTETVYNQPIDALFAQGWRNMHRLIQYATSITSRLIVVVLYFGAVNPLPLLAQGVAASPQQQFVVLEDTALHQQPEPASATAHIVPQGTLVRQIQTGESGQWHFIEWQEASQPASGWVPAANLAAVELLVTQDDVALREEPRADSAFARILPANTVVYRIATRNINNRKWQQVWANGEIVGWVLDGPFSVPYILTTVPTTLQTAPESADGLTIDLPESRALTLLEESPEGDFLRVQSPSGERGWIPSADTRSLPTVATGVVRLPAGLWSSGVNLRFGPSDNAIVIGRVFHDSPVTILGRDATGDWLRLITPQGRLAWLNSTFVTLDRGVVASLPVAAP
jgi:hypothetical protein